ncbi:MAG: monovalent cation/H+ antiporter complex subunit F [Candidatus Kapaibacterium sp.]
MISLTTILIYASMGMISLSVFILLIRLILGPSLEDRIVALDLITTTGIAYIAVYSVMTQTTTILDVGIIIGLVAFLGTIAFAYYLERRFE